MTFPSVVNSNTATTTSSTSHNLAMPSGLVAGNLLIACVAVDLGITAETVTGWTKYVEAARGDTTTTLWIFGRIATADGNDAGTLNAGVAGNWASIVYQISGWSGSLSSITATSTTSANDPPSLSVTTAADYLWLAGLGSESSVTAAPSGFSGLVTAAGGSTRASLAWLQANASSEDPGAFSGGATSPAACTVGIPPATGFPVVVNSATSSGAPSGISNQIPTLPTNIVPGNLLLWVIGTNSNGGVNTPNGYTKLGEVDNGTGNSSSLAAYARVATGTSGDSSAFTGFSGLQWATIVYQISGWDNSIADCVWAGTTGTLNPPSVTPSAGVNNYLWLALGVNWSTITGAPTNYTNLVTKSTSSTIKLGIAQRALNAGSEDPGAFSGTASYPQAATIAIQPAAPSNVSLSRSVSDTAAATDRCTVQYPRTASDTAAASDACTRQVSGLRAVSDTASAVDEATGNAATLQSRSVAEALAASESVTAHRSFYLPSAAVTESAPATDDTAHASGALPAPLLRLSALVGDDDNVIAIALNALMTFPPSETAPGTNVSRFASITETVQAVEALTSFTDQKLDENAPATDAASFVYIKNVFDTATASDVASAPVYVCDVFDTIAFSRETLTSNISYIVNASDVALGRAWIEDTAVAS